MANENSLKPPTKFNLRQKRLDGQSTDCTFICCEQSVFHAHKLILTSASPYFEKMFEGSFEEAKCGVARVDFDPTSLQTVLDYVYLEDDAHIEFEDLDQAGALLRASDMLHLLLLFGRSCVAVEKIMTRQDYLRIYDWDQLYSNEHTKKLLVNYITKFWKDIFDCNLHLKYDIDHFTRVLDQIGGSISGDTSGANTAIVGIINWVQADREARNNYTTSLFSKLKIQYLQLNDVRPILESEVVKDNCHVLVQLFKACLTYR